MTTGDERFIDVYRRYHRDIRAYCGRRTRPDAVDDAVADTFLTAWRRIDDVPAGDRALPWLYGVARKVLGHQWRGTSRRRKLADKLRSLGVDVVTEPIEMVVMRNESRRVIAAVERLGDTDREILLLAAWEELGHGDIATSLGISVGAVRQRFYQARKNLAKEYNRLEARSISSPAAQEGDVR